eukprot:4848322-Pyramimonas_sp.AAC.1
MTGLSAGCAQPTIGVYIAYAQSVHKSLLCLSTARATILEHAATYLSTAYAQAYGQAVHRPVIGLCGACV